MLEDSAYHENWVLGVEGMFLKNFQTYGNSREPWSNFREGIWNWVIAFTTTWRLLQSFFYLFFCTQPVMMNYWRNEKSLCFFLKMLSIFLKLLLCWDSLSILSYSFIASIGRKVFFMSEFRFFIVLFYDIFFLTTL